MSYASVILSRLDNEDLSLLSAPQDKNINRRTTVQRYKKHLQRIKKHFSAETPNSKVNALVDSPTARDRETIKKKLLYSEYDSDYDQDHQNDRNFSATAVIFIYNVRQLENTQGSKDPRKDPRIQERIQGSKKGSKDPKKDPRIQKRIQGSKKGPKDPRKDPRKDLRIQKRISDPSPNPPDPSPNQGDRGTIEGI
ncbi:hypothetical protein PV326_006233, partial [Microctonus aethiopoides]